MGIQNVGSKFMGLLDSYRVVSGQTQHVITHTSLASPAGAYHVPGGEIEHFLAMYSDAIASGATLHLTERPPTMFPVVVDIDLRLPAPTAPVALELAVTKTESVQVLLDTLPKRTYGREFLVDVAGVYAQAVRKLLSSCNTTCKDRRDGEDLVDTIECHVLQRPSPYVDGGKTKDGLHMIFPNIVLDGASQRLARKLALPAVQEVIAKHVPDVLNDIDDIVDKCAARNNWMMHGSSKPGRGPYEHVECLLFRQRRDGSEVLDKDAILPSCKDEDLVWSFSLRRARNPAALSAYGRELVKELVEEESKAKCKQLIDTEGFQSHLNSSTNKCNELELVRSLTSMLSPARADSYDSWMRVGWCLRNIDNTLLPDWVAFSQQSPKYQFGECEALWPHYRNENGLGIGTLHRWAREDSPEDYANHMSQRTHSLIDKAVATGSHFDVAKVVHDKFKDTFVCVSHSNGGRWYKFTGHRWQPTSKAVEMRTALSTSIHAAFEARGQEIAASGAGKSEEVADEARKKSLKYREMCKSLKTTGYKDNVMREACDLFYREKFEGALDGNPNLIGFENGVYDLDKGVFRDGLPDDMVSMTTGNDYVDCPEDCPEMREIEDYFAKVFTSPGLREYFLSRMAAYISGRIIKEEFMILTGSGSNAKSLTVNLLQQVLGDYAVNLPTALMTQKRGASNAASPEIARLKGKRLAVMQEPSDTDRLNISILKEATGSDMMQARPLYGEPFEFRPQFSMVMCCNTLPIVPDNDGGTWRRIKVVEFSSKFTSNPDPEDPTQFPIDLHLSNRFPKWRPAVLCMLLRLHAKYKDSPLREPPEVNRASEEYRAEQDLYSQFVQESFEKGEATDKLSIGEVHAVFRSWAKQRMMIGLAQRMSSSQLAKKITTMGRIRLIDNKAYWTGWRVIESSDDYAA